MAWNNMRARVAGRRDSTGAQRWAGLPIGWDNYEEFRTWALANGYAPGLVLDHRPNGLGYVPGNCEWITKAENCRRAAALHNKRTCNCVVCIKWRRANRDPWGPR